MARANEKTNVMRILEQKKIPYTAYCYLDSGVVSGPEVAAVLEQDPAHVYKTLVTVGHSGTHYVFVLAVDRELDLKRAAAAVGEKNIAMLKSKNLLPLTGYVHGGCSPVGMKKQFKTVIDAPAEQLETLFCSGGRIGYQVELAPTELQRAVPFTYAEISTKMP